MKRLSAVIAFIAVTTALVISPSAALGDAWFATGQGTQDGTMIAAITESADYGGVSRRINRVNHANGTFDEFLCPNGPEATGGCALDSPEDHFDSDVVLPTCKSDTQTDCVESLKFGKVGEDLKDAKLVREVQGQKYEALEKFGGLPAGGTISIWDSGELPNTSGSTKYAVQVTEQAFMDLGMSAYLPNSIIASVIPISDRSGDKYRTASLSAFQDQNGFGRLSGWGFEQECAVTEANYCGVTENFAEKSRFSLSIRVSNKITGWFRGRIQNPNVSIEKFSDTNNRITMAAEPVSVPRLAALVTPENTTAKGKELLSHSMVTGKMEMFKGDTLRNTHPDSHDSLTWVEEFRAAAKDTAAAVSTLWTFGTLALFGNENNCFKDKTRVIGVVTTNATALSEGTPDFSNGMLDYKVAGLHYAPDGKTLNEGSYDLVMRSDVARCLYGFSKAPISAKVSVIGDAGEVRTAVTTVKEADGWIKIAAYGYTFSSPTISVKLTQASAKKATITCVKGKTTKKVTAVGAKCPAGYKQK